MINNYLHFWNVMETNFNKEGKDMPETFWKEMSVIGNSIAKVWELGMCPDFNLNISNTFSYQHE
jgi:hypothetical protein